MPELNTPPPLEDTGKCPKCGYTRDPSWTECPACGVIFARLRPATAELSPPPPPTSEEDGLYNPYQAPRADVYEPAAGKGQLELADAGMRLLAQIINNLLFAVMIVVGFIPFFTLGQGEEPGCGHFGLMAIMAMVWCSWNWSWLAKYGQSVGKRMLNMRVVMSNGEPATMGRLVGMRLFVGRGILGIIPFYGLVDALFIFRDDRRCVHDHVADTIVVRTPPGWQGETF